MLNTVRQVAKVFPGLFLILAFYVSCSHESADDPESQPTTPVLGSGDHLVDNASTLVVLCSSFFNGNPSEVGCVAAISGGSGDLQQRHIRQTQTQSDTEATGWGPDVSAHNWSQLSVNINGSISEVTGVPSSDGLSIVYTLTYDASTQPAAQYSATLNVIINNVPSSVQGTADSIQSPAELTPY